LILTISIKYFLNNKKYQKININDTIKTKIVLFSSNFSKKNKDFLEFFRKNKNEKKIVL
jgi:hypothetical protein